MKDKLLISFFAVSLMWVCFACDVNDTSQTGRIKVTLTDAPANYEAVWIEVESVMIHKNGEENENGDDEDSGWIIITDESRRINLLDLRNGNEITLSEVELQTGTYSQLRLILGDVNEVMVDGETHNLITPGAQQTGLKVNINAEIETDETFNLLIDFDVAQSIVLTGNGMYILKPVLRTVNQDQSGSISGDVEPDDLLTTVTAINGEDFLSTITDDDGQFTILGAVPGAYQVLFEMDNGQYKDTTLTNIEVSAGEKTDLETITLSAAK